MMKLHQGFVQGTRRWAQSVRRWRWSASCSYCEPHGHDRSVCRSRSWLSYNFPPQNRLGQMRMGGCRERGKCTNLGLERHVFRARNAVVGAAGAVALVHEKPCGRNVLLAVAAQLGVTACLRRRRPWRRLHRASPIWLPYQTHVNIFANRPMSANSEANQIHPPSLTPPNTQTLLCWRVC